jgi:hypothetical protein
VVESIQRGDPNITFTVLKEPFNEIARETDGAFIHPFFPDVHGRALADTSNVLLVFGSKRVSRKALHGVMISASRSDIVQE